MRKGSFQEKLLERFCGQRPQSWKTIRLGEFFSERVERREPDESYPLYSFTIEAGVTPKTDRYERSFLVKEDGEDSFKTVYPGDFVMNPMNLRWGAIGLSKTKTPVTVSGYYDVLIPKFNKGAGLLQNLLRSYQLISLYDIVATGSLLEKRRVHCSQFLDLRIYWPPESELEKLCDILTTWDEALTQLDALIEAQERRKKALMQQLLRGRRRLMGFSKPWMTAKLGTLFKERIEQGRGDLPLLSITADRGIVPREDVAKRDSSSEDKSKYLRIVPGDIGYNTMRMWQGVSALSALEGIVSPAYTICKPTDRIDGRFAAHFFKFRHTVHLFHRYSQGLVDDTLNLKFPSFAVIEVSIPSDLEEQRQIAALLDTADQQLTLLHTQRIALDQQKRGLMQRLLTGKLRVTSKSI